MDHNPFIGVGFHAAGGIAHGSFYAPLKRVRTWAWESAWLVAAAMLVLVGSTFVIAVGNRWANRIIGDKQPPAANARTVECPPGFLGGQEIQTDRFTFSTSDPYERQSPLLPFGLLGPVQLLTQHPETTKCNNKRNLP